MENQKIQNIKFNFLISFIFIMIYIGVQYSYKIQKLKLLVDLRELKASTISDSLIIFRQRKNPKFINNKLYCEKTRVLGVKVDENNHYEMRKLTSNEVDSDPYVYLSGRKAYYNKFKVPVARLSKSLIPWPSTYTFRSDDSLVDHGFILYQGRSINVISLKDALNFKIMIPEAEENGQIISISGNTGHYCKD
jgi:hypothetical protein